MQPSGEVPSVSKGADTINITRAPVVTLWAAVVAERLGSDRPTVRITIMVTEASRAGASRPASPACRSPR